MRVIEKPKVINDRFLFNLMNEPMCLQLIIFLLIISFGSCSQPQKKEFEYFVRPCEFVCDYPFNDTTKWAVTCRVWGLLKYYHPNVTAGKIEWDKVLLDRVEIISNATTPEQVNTELKSMLEEAGKYPYKKDDNWDASRNMNVNLCWLDNSFLDSDLKKELKKIISQIVPYPSFYGISIESAYHLIEQEKAYPIEFELLYSYRLLALFRYWNIIYYYFPHKYLMDKSWDKILNETIFPFIHATDQQTYQIEFLKLSASLNDGHAYNTIAPCYPLECLNTIEKVGSHTIVKIDKGGLYKGDIINYIAERHIDHIRDSLSVLIPASTQLNKEYRINCYVAEMVFFQETAITILREGKEHKLHMLPVTFEKEDLKSYKMLSDDIGYADLSLVTNMQIDSMFRLFNKAKGVIFDLRKKIPDDFDQTKLNSYLVNSGTLDFGPLAIWDPEHPGAYVWIENVSVTIPDSIEFSPFSGKRVFLINEFTQSALETKALDARINCQATLIGRPTSGALGRVAFIPLLGNHRTTFSCAALFSFDKKELQRKGIVPDIEVYPTLESIKNGEDEIVEAAIKYLNEQ